MIWRLWRHQQENVQRENDMISNDRSSSYGTQTSQPLRPPVAEATLKTDKIQIERKTFVFALKENPRGRFLRITEDVGGRRDTIIVPAPGLEDFKRVVDEMVKHSNEVPPTPAPASGA
jgi:hypothetical protein